MEIKSKNLVALLCKDPENEPTKSKFVRSMGEQEAKKFYKNIVDNALEVHKNQRDYDFVVASKIQRYFENKRFNTIKLPHEGLRENVLYLIEKGVSTYDKLIIQNPTRKALTSEEIQTYLNMLDSNDLVLGPNSGGRLYLIGLKENLPIFPENFDTNLFNKTISNAEKFNLKYKTLDVLE